MFAAQTTTADVASFTKLRRSMSVSFERAILGANQNESQLPDSPQTGAPGIAEAESGRGIPPMLSNRVFPAPSREVKSMDKGRCRLYLRALDRPHGLQREGRAGCDLLARAKRSKVAPGLSRTPEESRLMK